MMTTIYAVCFLFGLGLSVVSFMAGVDHDFNIFDKLFSHGAGHHGSHGGKVKVHAKHGAHGQKSHVTPFNLAALTAFLAWFGGAGLLLQQTTRLSNPITVGASVGVGVLGATMVNRFMLLLMRREREVPRLTMSGTIARVVVPIRENGGTGEIVFTHDGTRHVAGARSEDGRGIEKGMEVVVIRYEKGIAYVQTWDELAAITPAS